MLALLAVGLGLLGACRTLWPWNGGAATSTPPVRVTIDDIDGPPEMRVRVAKRRTELRIGGPALVHARTTSDAAVLAAPIRVTLDRSGWVVVDADGTRRIRADDLELTAAGDAPITLDGIAMGETLHLCAKTRSGDGAPAIDAVARVPIETYVAGVIAKELYPGWKPEAYRAQAIAARSYALHRRALRLANGAHYDVESTTRDQAFGGVTSSPVALEAAHATAGTVLAWAGEILCAYYSSTSGGRAASAADVWPVGPGTEYNLAAPIQASPREGWDSFSPRHRWKVVRDQRTLTERFRVYARRQGLGFRDIDLLASVEPVARNAFDRPTRYRIADSRGTWWEIEAEVLRLACNASAGDRLPPPKASNRVSSGDVEFDIRAGTVTILGRGFGHGVGMSQFGAEGMARAGRSAEAILEHYYPGAELVQVY